MRLCLYRGGSTGLGGAKRGRRTVGTFLLCCEVGQVNGKESTCLRQLLEGHSSYSL